MCDNDDMAEIRNAQDLVRGETYVVRSTVSGFVGATFRGRFGSELGFDLADGSWVTIPVAYFRDAVS
jgi:hypothetical protein